MLDDKLSLKLFEAFSIERWNDLVRPFRPIEMDHAAEKMFLSFIIGKYEEKKKEKICWDRIITHSVFALLQKIALSDIKAPIQYLIRTSYKEEYKDIKKWIFDKYSSLIDNEEFVSNFHDYLFKEECTQTKEDEILFASHQATSFRELEMLSPCNEPFRLEKIMKSIEKDIWKGVHLDGVKLFLQKDAPYKLITEIEKLRFQIRWNQTPRVPHTSVLSHSYYVALLSLLMCYDLNLPKDRLYTNFFCGLFHDFPEAATRDIISPVKTATDSLPKVVKEIEEKVVREELLPLVDESYRDEVLYYIQDEFENRAMVGGEVVLVENYEELGSKYARNRPCDGRLIRLADHIAAFVEAESSIRFGITSSQLKKGRDGIIEAYPIGKQINGLCVEKFFRNFRRN